MCCSLLSAYVTWSFGLATTSAGTLEWDLRCAIQSHVMYLFKVPCLYSIVPSVTFLFVCFFPWPGTCSSALQGAAGEARWASEESGWVTARAHQSLSVILWTARLPYTFHHSSANLRLTLWPLSSLQKLPWHHKTIVCQTTSLVIHHRGWMTVFASLTGPVKSVVLCHSTLLQLYCTLREHVLSVVSTV